MAHPGGLNNQRLSALFEFEHRVRTADTLQTLRFIIANEARGVVDYDHAALLEPTLSGWHITTLSDVPGVDRNSLFAEFVERSFAVQTPESGTPQVLDAEMLGEWERGIWSEVSPAHVLLVPLAAPGGEPVAWLWVARATAFDDTEQFLWAHVGEVSGHAFAALSPRTGRLRPWARLRRRWVLVAALVIMALILAIPVHLSALAPAEIVARDPAVITAPMDGVVDRVLVEPNVHVTSDQPLVRMQDIKARNAWAVATQALKVAETRLETARHKAFSDRQARAELAQLSAQVDLQKTRRAHARHTLDRVVLKAGHDGLVVFDDPGDWRGRPVQTGERIMLLANPDERKVRIELPVDDAMLLTAGAPIKLFLDAHPLKPLSGHVVRVAYQPRVDARGRMVYRVTARLDEQRDFLRIGLHGTARISGHRVPLIYYLLRRPFTALRQMIGY